MRAALELIAEKGPAGFTFAEAARWAGVSPAAPYRHFRDRDELIANVALRGFEEFKLALARAWNGGRPDALTAFDRLGSAYLGFARAEPAYYSAMFEAGIPASMSIRNCARRASAPSPCCARPPKSCGANAATAPAAGADGRAASLGDGARRRFAVRPRRRGAPHAADAAGGTAGGRCADLSARSRRFRSAQR